MRKYWEAIDVEVAPDSGPVGQFKNLVTSILPHIFCRTKHQ
jgi:hypothetical protein